jgi:hypothetical protein
MAKELVNGVYNYYGARHTYEGVQGKLPMAGAEGELVIHFSGDTYLTVTGSMPAGAMVTGHALLEVTEAFALGGTTPVINIGVSGTEGTNRLAQISEAQAEAVGTYAIASAGTLAEDAVLAAAATIKIALGGTSPTITAAGKAKLVIPYRVI